MWTLSIESFENLRPQKLHLNWPYPKEKMENIGMLYGRVLLQFCTDNITKIAKQLLPE